MKRSASARSHNAKDTRITNYKAEELFELLYRRDDDGDCLSLSTRQVARALTFGGARVPTLRRNQSFPSGDFWTDPKWLHAQLQEMDLKIESRSLRQGSERTPRSRDAVAEGSRLACSPVSPHLLASLDLGRGAVAAVVGSRAPALARSRASRPRHTSSIDRGRRRRRRPSRLPRLATARARRGADHGFPPAYDHKQVRRPHPASCGRENDETSSPSCLVGLIYNQNLSPQAPDGVPRP